MYYLRIYLYDRKRVFDIISPLLRTTYLEKQKKKIAVIVIVVFGEKVKILKTLTEMK